MLLAPRFAVTRSTRPSRSQSPAARPLTRVPTARVVAKMKLPSPLPWKTVIFAVSRLVTARSTIPSLFRSAAASSAGALPAGNRLAAKVMSPLPSRTETSLSRTLATARSAIPSRLKSAATMPPESGQPPSGPEGQAPVTLTGQDRYVVREVVNHGQVQMTITIEVAGDNTRRERAYRDSLLEPECAIAHAENDRDVVTVPIGDSKVGVPVGVPVPDGNRDRSHADGNALALDKVPEGPPSKMNTSSALKWAIARSRLRRH